MCYFFCFVAFISAYYSHFLQLRAKIGEDFPLVRWAFKIQVICLVYGFAGLGALIALMENAPEQFEYQTNNYRQVIGIFVLTISTGWGSKGIIDAQVIPKGSEGLKISDLIKLIIRDSEINSLIADRSYSYFDACTSKLEQEGISLSDLKDISIKYLGLHPVYGRSQDPAAITKYNRISKSVNGSNTTHELIDYIHSNVSHSDMKKIVKKALK